MFYIYKIATDGITRLFIFEDSFILFGSPVIPLIVFFMGFLLVKTTKNSNKILDLAARIGLIFFPILAVIGLSFLNALSGPTGGESPAILLFIPPIIFLSIAVIFSLVLALAGFFSINAKYVGFLTLITLGAFLLYLGLDVMNIPESVQNGTADNATLTFCEKIKGTTYGDDCYRNLARIKADPLLCANISRELTRELCNKETQTVSATKNAITARDYKLCDQAPNKDDCLQQIGTELADYNICKLITTTTLSSRLCFRDVAVKKKDPSICNKISLDSYYGDYYIQDCKRDVANSPR